MFLSFLLFFDKIIKIKTVIFTKCNIHKNNDGDDDNIIDFFIGGKFVDLP